MAADTYHADTASHNFAAAFLVLFLIGSAAGRRGCGVFIYSSDRVLRVVVEHVREVRLLIIRRRLLRMRFALPLHALVVPVRRQALVVRHRDGAPLELPPVLRNSRCHLSQTNETHADSAMPRGG